MRKFGLLGPINRNLQKFLSGFFHWKQTHIGPPVETGMNDFYEMTPLRNAETLFYKVGLTPEEASDVLDKQFQTLRDFARWIVAQVYATVLDNPAIADDAAFRDRIRLRDLQFDPEKMRMEYESAGMKSEVMAV
jgi:hypothetical protein